MATINITKLVSPTLRNRDRAHQIRQFVIDSKENEVILDFSEVTWIGRSFMDEFVELFIVNPPCHITIVNMDELSQTMLQVVKRTHNNPIGSFVQSESKHPEITPFNL